MTDNARRTGAALVRCALVDYAGLDLAITGRHKAMDRLERITRDPNVMGGKPCIRGLRVTVGMIVGQIAAGRSVRDILDDFPYLEEADIREALRYAAWRAEEREIELAHE